MSVLNFGEAMRRRDVITLLGGNGLLAGAPSFRASAVFPGETARTRTVSFSSGGSARQYQTVVMYLYE